MRGGALFKGKEGRGDFRKNKGRMVNPFIPTGVAQPSCQHPNMDTPSE